MTVLIIEQWDPVSKQPMFKSGAVRIEKCVQKEARHAIEEQSQAVQHVEQTEMDTERKENRVRWLEMWLGATHEALEELRSVYNDIIPRLVKDLEIQAGLEIMLHITHDMIQTLEPVVHRYHESRLYGRKVCERLRGSLFPMDEMNNSYESLIVLQSLDMFLTYIEGHLTALSPASQALWDRRFVDAVTFAQTSIQRQKAWVAQHIKVKSPQTLLVPQSPPRELGNDGQKMAREFYY